MSSRRVSDMTLSPILRRSLMPFVDTSDHFLLQTPNRFAVPVRERRKGAIRNTIVRDAYWVIGTLPQRFEQCGWFSMEALTRGALESVAAEPSIPNFARVRSSEPVVRFTLSAEDMDCLLKAARTLRSTHFEIDAEDRAVRLTAFCQDSSNTHWFEPSYLRHGIQKFKANPGGIPVPALRWDARNRFSLNVAGEVVSPVKRSFSAGVRKFLCTEDYEIALYGNHAVEIASVESGLAIIVGTVRSGSAESGQPQISADPNRCRR